MSKSVVEKCAHRPGWTRVFYSQLRSNLFAVNANRTLRNLYTRQRQYIVHEQARRELSITELADG